MRIAFSSKHVFAVALLVGGCGSNATPAPTPAAAGPADVTEAQSSALGRLAREGGAAWTWSLHAHNGTLTHLGGRSAPILTRGVSGHAATLSFLGRYRELFKMADPARELVLVREEKDAHANTHVRLQQVASGVPVRGGEMIAHYDRDGALTSIDAHYAPGLSSIYPHAVLRPENADAAATTDLAKDVPALDTSRLARPTAPLLRIFAPAGGVARLAYHVRLRGDAANQPILMDYMIDAETGVVLEKYNDIETLTGSGVGVLGDTKTLQISQNGTYQLIDTTRAPGGIRTSTAGGQETTPGELVASQTSTSFDTGGAAAGSAVDAHFYAGLVYDYYKASHARAGIDGQDSAVISTVHYGAAYNNAFWDGTQMSYGDGDGTQFRGFSASLDVVGHELTHGVTGNSSNLQYLRQSGALNEAVSDIFGALVEHGIKPDPVKNWTLGEDLSLTGSPFRDMIHPAKGQQPSNMSQYVNTTTDNGGVHTNSGIVNNAMYLMTMGGTNDGSKTVVSVGLGWEKAGKIWYHANTKYFMTTTDFAGAAQGTLSSARDLSLSENEQNIVECAWIAVGVLTGACKPLTVEAPPTPDAGASSGGDDAGTPPSGAVTGDPPAASDTPGAEDPTGGSTPTPTKHPRSGFGATAASSGCSASPMATPGEGGALALVFAGVWATLRRRRTAKRG